MALKAFKVVDEQDRRIFMAGLTFTQYVGFKSPREFCKRTTLMVGDVDSDEMLFFSNTIDKDEKEALDGNTGRLSDYFNSTIPAYIDEEYQEEAAEFYSNENLRDSYDMGLMSDSIEYPCTLENGTMWIRGCYNLELDEETNHVIATIILIDVTFTKKNQ